MEKELYWELKVKPEWKISGIVGEVYEHPSKEAAFLVKKFEEMHFRIGGGWTAEEIAHLKSMLSITRGHDLYDVRYVCIWLMVVGGRYAVAGGLCEGSECERPEV